MIPVDVPLLPRLGDLVFVSGQLGVDPSRRELVEGGIQEQTRQAIDNVATILGGGRFVAGSSGQGHHFSDGLRVAAGDERGLCHAVPASPGEDDGGNRTPR